MDAGDPADSSGAFTDADSARAYLNSLSAHPARKGDTSFLHPDFALKMANAIKQARDAGLPVTLQSGYRSPTTTGSAYDAAGYSLHGYGAATDIGGIGGAGSPQAKQWAAIAQANGIYNPYGVSNPKEYNHWQLVPWKLEDRPDIQKSLADAGGDAGKIWNAIAPAGAPTMAYSGGKTSPATAAIAKATAPKEVDPFAEYPTAGHSAGKAAVEVDPFSEYSTTPSATPAPSAAPVAANPAPAKDADPFAEFPTSAAVNAPAPARSEPAGPIGVNDAVRAASTGVPIVGGLLNKMDAATNATIAPVFNRFFSPGEQLQGGTWGERYKNALATQEGMDQRFAAGHPVANTALSIAGGIAGTAPAMLAAPAAFGAAEGAPLVVNALTGAATGAGIGAADNMARNGVSTQNAESGAFWGGLGGAAGPAIGAGFGKAVKSASNLFSRTTPEAVKAANMLREAGMTPQEAEAAIARMGPDATFADINPLMADHAAAIASKGGSPTAILKAAMMARGSAADGRVEQSVVQNLGGRPDLTATKDAIETGASAAAKPFYDAARANPTPMDATPVVQYIDGQLATAKGGVAKTLQMARGLITKPSPLPGVTVPEDNAQGLLGARQALDDFIKRGGDADTTAGKNALREASAVRDKIDKLVKSDPNIEAGDKAFSSKIVASSDLDAGNEIFKPSTNLEDFRRGVAAASADPARLQAMQKGALAALHDKIGGQQGDYAAARNLLAKGTLNRAKLEALFPNASGFFDSLEGEIAKRGTENTIRAGSQTANKLGIAKEYDIAQGSPLDPGAALIGNALDGGTGAAVVAGGKAIYGSLHNAFTESANKKLREGLARGLVATGPEQSKFLGQVSRAYGAQPVTQGASNLAAFGSNLLARPPLEKGLRAKLEETPLRGQ
jgi:hypothetical protein